MMAKKTAQGLNVGVFQVMADMHNGDPAVIAKCAEESKKEAQQIPAVLFTHADGFHTCLPQHLFKGAWVKVNHSDLKVRPAG